MSGSRAMEEVFLARFCPKSVQLQFPSKFLSKGMDVRVDDFDLTVDRTSFLRCARYRVAKGKKEKEREGKKERSSPRYMPHNSLLITGYG